VWSGFIWLQIGSVGGLFIFNYRHRCGNFSNPVTSLDGFPLEQGYRHFVTVDIENLV
jgi:hypothetical protein